MTWREWLHKAAVQLGLFGDREEVQAPGSRGGKFYTTRTGHVRYGDRPIGAARQQALDFSAIDSAAANARAKVEQPVLRPAKPESAIDAAMRRMGLDPDAPPDKARDLRRKAKDLERRALALLDGVPPGQPVNSARDRNKRDRSAELMRQAGELSAQADQVTPASPPPPDEPAPSPTAPADPPRGGPGGGNGGDDGGDGDRTEPVQEEFWVPAFAMEDLQGAVDALNKRAKRLKLQPMTVKVVGSQVRRREVQESTFQNGGPMSAIHTMRVTKYLPIADGEPYNGPRFEFLQVKIEGQSPKLNGWQFVGVIDHGDDDVGNIVHRTDESFALPVEVYDAGPTCEHCHTKRDRKKTVLVRHDDGRFKRVGTSCLRDFLGHASAEDLLRAAEFRGHLIEILDQYGREEGWGFDEEGRPRRGRGFELQGFLEFVSADMRRRGFVKRSQDYGDRTMPTADFVESVYADIMEGKKPSLEPTDSDRARAQRTIEWVNDLYDDEATKQNDYLWNLAVIGRRGFVGRKHSGYAASMIAAHERALARVAEEQKKQESNYVGEVGKRHDFGTVTVEHVTSRQGTYGTTWIHFVRDDAGNRLTWFGSGSPLREGCRYSLTAMVKEHETYRGEKQTIINRPAADIVHEPEKLAYRDAVFTANGGFPLYNFDQHFRFVQGELPTAKPKKQRELIAGLLDMHRRFTDVQRADIDSFFSGGPSAVWTRQPGQELRPEKEKEIRDAVDRYIQERREQLASLGIDDGLIVKAEQLGFSFMAQQPRKEVQRPGSRGGRYRVTKEGKVRYDQEPAVAVGHAAPVIDPRDTPIQGGRPKENGEVYAEVMGVPTAIRPGPDGDPFRYQSWHHQTTEWDAQGYPTAGRKIHAATRDEYVAQLAAIQAQKPRPVELPPAPAVPKPVELLSPGEARGYKLPRGRGADILPAMDMLAQPLSPVRDRVEDENLDHAIEVATAARAGRPVSAAAVDAYGLNLPESYSRDGDRYVERQPGMPPAVPAQGAPVVAIGATPDPKQAAKLRRVADGMTEAIEHDLNPGVENQNPTRRRSEIARGMRERGEAEKRAQLALYALADMWAEGAVPEELRGVTTRRLVEALLAGLPRKGRDSDGNDVMRSRFPQPYVHRSWLRDMVDEMKGKRLPEGAREWVRMLALEVDSHYQETGRDTLDLSGERALKLDAIALEVGRGATAKWDPASRVRAGISDAKAAIAAGIDTPEKWDAAARAINALAPREFVSSRDERIMQLKRSLIGTKKPGYFPTPKPLVDQMLEMANIGSGARVLEPSAGKGNIAEAIRKAHPDAELATIEIDTDLREILELEGFPLVARDFVEFAADPVNHGTFDVVVQNPPFEHGQDVAHLKAALAVCKSGGRVVSIMGEHPFFAMDRASQDFREWLDEHDAEDMKLDPGSFKSSERPTGVNCRLVVVRKRPGD